MEPCKTNRLKKNTLIDTQKLYYFRSFWGIPGFPDILFNVLATKSTTIFTDNLAEPPIITTVEYTITIDEDGNAVAETKTTSS